jgi:5'-3' exonuclease
VNAQSNDDDDGKNALYPWAGKIRENSVNEVERVRLLLEAVDASECDLFKSDDRHRLSRTLRYAREQMEAAEAKERERREGVTRWKAGLISFLASSAALVLGWLLSKLFGNSSHP